MTQKYDDVIVLVLQEDGPLQLIDLARRVQQRLRQLGRIPSRHYALVNVYNACMEAARRGIVVREKGVYRTL